MCCGSTIAGSTAFTSTERMRAYCLFDVDNIAGFLIAPCSPGNNRLA